MSDHIRASIFDNNGFGLLELVISLGLLTMVLALGFTFYIFLLTTFDTGERQTDVQQNARLAGDFITDETRIAERMVIIDEYDGDIESIDVDTINEVIDGGIDDDEFLYFIYIENGSIYHQKVDDLESPDTATVLENISDKIEFELEFALSEKGNDILQFDLSTRDKETNRTYSIDKEVLILNLDEIEDESGGKGKAIFYQIPAPPDPSIRSVRLNRYDHVFGSQDSEDILEITVYTSNVSDVKNEEVSVNFYRLSQEGSIEDTDIQEDKAEVKDNQAELTLEGLEDLYFGYYFVEVASVEETFASQRRDYYVEPTIELEKMESRPGNPHIGTITLKTGGLPIGTEVSKGMPEDDGFLDHMFVELVNMIDANEEEYESVEFDFHGDDDIKVEGNEEDGYGTVEFGIKVEDPEDAAKDLNLKVSIGNDQYFLNIYEDLEFEYLGSLEVWDGDADDELELEPKFDPESDDDDYEISNAGDLDKAKFIAELYYDDEAKLKIDGELIESDNDLYISDVKLDEGEDVIEIPVEIISGEDDFVIRTYTVTIHRNEE